MDEENEQTNLESQPEMHPESINQNESENLEQVNPSSRVIVRKKFVITLLIIVGLILFISLTGKVVIDRTFCSGVSDAKNQISQRTEFIEGINIEGFTRSKPQTSVGGDCFTASASSASVTAEFNGTPTAGIQIEESVDKIMKERGFTKQEEYYGFFRNYDYEKMGQEITWVGTYYENNGQRYAVNYNLVEPFICTEDISCLDPWGSYSGGGSDVTPFQLRSLLERDFEKISISNRPSDGQLP